MDAIRKPIIEITGKTAVDRRLYYFMGFILCMFFLLVVTGKANAESIDQGRAPTGGKAPRSQPSVIMGRSMDPEAAGNAERLKMRVDYINAKAVEGRVPLVMACRLRYFDVVKYLIDKGAEVNAMNAR
jgi:hypothetical protein